MDPAWVENWSRQILLPEIGVSGQERLCQSTAFVGGGAGLDLLKTYLTASGIGSIRAVGDFVPASDQVVGWVGTPVEIRPLVAAHSPGHKNRFWAVVLENSWVRGPEWSDTNSPILTSGSSPDPAATLSAACWVATQMILTLCGSLANPRANGAKTALSKEAICQKP